MNYTSPDSIVYTYINVVGTSMDDTPPTSSNNGSSSGGIQLPFIPG